MAGEVAGTPWVWAELTVNPSRGWVGSGWEGSVGTQSLGFQAHGVIMGPRSPGPRSDKARVSPQRLEKPAGGQRQAWAPSRSWTPSQRPPQDRPCLLQLHRGDPFLTLRSCLPLGEDGVLGVSLGQAPPRQGQAETGRSGQQGRPGPDPQSRAWGRGLVASPLWTHLPSRKQTPLSAAPLGG